MQLHKWAFNSDKSTLLYILELKLAVIGRLYLYESSPCPSIMMFCQYLIDKRHVDMTAHMIGQLIILFFFEFSIVECPGGGRKFVGKATKQNINKLWVVEDAANVCTHAGIINTISVGSAVFQQVQRRSRSKIGR